jgi:hypothetical protein
MRASLSENPDAIESVALAIGRVVAAKAIDQDARLKRLDGLGKAMASQSMALEMAPLLREEAAAAIKALENLEAADERAA